MANAACLATRSFTSARSTSLHKVGAGGPVPDYSSLNGSVCTPRVETYRHLFGASSTWKVACESRLLDDFGSGLIDHREELKQDIKIIS